MKRKQIIILPVTVMRDTLNNFFQLIIPQHPFCFAGAAILKESGEHPRPGFSGGAGFTGGGVDLRFRYTQSIRYSGGFIRDLYTAGIEFTLNIPLQQKFIRTEPLID